MRRGEKGPEMSLLEIMYMILEVKSLKIDLFFSHMPMESNLESGMLAARSIKKWRTRASMLIFGWIKTQGLYTVGTKTTVGHGWTRWDHQIKLGIKGSLPHPGMAHQLSSQLCFTLHWDFWRSYMSWESLIGRVLMFIQAVNSHLSSGQIKFKKTLSVAIGFRSKKVNTHSIWSTKDLSTEEEFTKMYSNQVRRTLSINWDRTYVWRCLMRLSFLMLKMQEIALRLLKMY